jgi:hypothetical protein
MRQGEYSSCAAKNSDFCIVAAPWRENRYADEYTDDSLPAKAGIACRHQSAREQMKKSLARFAIVSLLSVLSGGKWRIHHFSIDRLIVGALAAVWLLAIGSNAYAAGNGQCIELDMKPRGAILHTAEVCLGIRFKAATPWESLGEQQRAEWAEYVDLSVPNVTPPYPLPNARALLNNIAVPEEVKKQGQSLEDDPLTRVNVHIDEQGKVTRVDMLINNAEIESLLFTAAILGTRFSPAKMNGQSALSSIILELHRPFHLAERKHAK